MGTLGDGARGVRVIREEVTRAALTALLWAGPCLLHVQPKEIKRGVPSAERCTQEVGGVASLHGELALL